MLPKLLLNYPHREFDDFSKNLTILFVMIYSVLSWECCESSRKEVTFWFHCGKNVKCLLSVTPARTLSISGLKSRVLKLSFFNLKIMMKNGLYFFLKSTEPLQRYLLTCLANSAFLGRFFFALGSSNSEGARWISK